MTRGEAFSCASNKFGEKVSKLEAGVGSLTTRRSSLVDTDHPVHKGGLLLPRN